MTLAHSWSLEECSEYLVLVITVLKSIAISEFTQFVETSKNNIGPPITDVCSERNSTSAGAFSTMVHGSILAVKINHGIEKMELIRIIRLFEFDIVRSDLEVETNDGVAFFYPRLLSLNSTSVASKATGKA